LYIHLYFDLLVCHVHYSYSKRSTVATNDVDLVPAVALDGVADLRQVEAASRGTEDRPAALLARLAY
jgi:hypothetical protein